MAVTIPVEFQNRRFQKNHRSTRCLPILFTAGFLSLLITATAGAAETGTITGQIVDKEGRAIADGNVVVFLGDDKSGLPVMTKTAKPLVPTQHMDGIRGFGDIWHALPDDRGQFEFVDVPVGKYRLMAQSWPGSNGIPDFLKEKNTTVMLHGVAEGLKVTANNSVQAKLKPLGNGTLKIINDPEASHDFLFISRKPRMGDGVLGPLAWGEGFLSGLIGVTQMEKPFVTLKGLPDGDDIHAAILNYDNNPGLGGDTYRVGKEQVVRLEIFATWSNGKYEPPPKLAKLTDYLDEHKLTASRLLGLDGPDYKNHEAIWTAVRTQPDRKYRIAEVGEFHLVDILAALRYQQLRQHHRDRKK